MMRSAAVDLPHACGTAECPRQSGRQTRKGILTLPQGLLVPKSCSGVRGDAGQAQRAGPEGHGMGFQKGRVAFDVRDDVRVNSEVLGGLILFHD